MTNDGDGSLSPVAGPALNATISFVCITGSGSGQIEGNGSSGWLPSMHLHQS